MKILVAVKRVVDYNVKVHALADKTDVDIAASKMSMNPFDEIAVETAVRLKEKGVADTVVAVSCGPEKTQDTLRVAMAIGADRSIHVGCDTILDPFTVAEVLCEIAKRESPDLILMGKQATDNDCAQIPQMVSALLNLPVATFANQIEINDSEVTVQCETDDGLTTVKGTLPAVVSCDLRLSEPRYVTLPMMMKARKKPIEKMAISELGIDTTRRVKIVEVEDAPKREGGVKLESVDALIDQLKNVKKVL